jgi:hypothetical protein
MSGYERLRCQCVSSSWGESRSIARLLSFSLTGRAGMTLCRRLAYAGRRMGGRGHQGFIGTRGAFAPACGVNAPIRWVPQRTSCSGSMIEHGLHQLCPYHESGGGTSLPRPDEMDSLEVSHKNRAFGRKSPPPERGGTQTLQDLDLTTGVGVPEPNTRCQDRTSLWQLRRTVAAAAKLAFVYLRARSVRSPPFADVRSL